MLWPQPLPSLHAWTLTPDWSSKLSASIVAAAERSRGGFGVATTGAESALLPWLFVALTTYRYAVPLTTLVSTYSGSVSARGDRRVRDRRPRRRA